MKGKILTSISLVFIILLTLCPCAFAKTGVLKGQVVDGYGKAVKGVDISIKSTKFTSKTDVNGKYSISYKIGQIDISFKKKNYAPQSFVLNIRDVKEVPLPKLTFWQFPESGGIFLVGINNYKKVAESSYYSERNEESVSFYVKDVPTKISISKDSLSDGFSEFLILDYSKESPLVVGKELYKVDENKSVGTIIFKTRNWGLEGIGDEYIKISNRLGMRHVKLEPGRYFYCIGEIVLRSKIGFGYFFEILIE